MHRLTGETITDPVAGNYSASYQYDAVGNRVYSIIDGVHTSYSVDANDRLLGEGETHYSYDANGSLIQEVQGADETSYSYNARNLLAEVITDTAAGVSVAGYRYNPDGIRTSQSVDGVSTQLLVDSNRDYAQVVAEVDATGAATGEYVHGLDLLSQHRAGVRRDYLADGLGSVRGLSQGVTVVDDYRYDAWGNQLYRSGSSANPYLYSGEWYDSALDQYYLRARTYAPQSGRFVQMDSWMGRQGEPVTLHKYLYGNGDPANTVDPSGHFGLVSMGVAMNIRSTLSNMQIEVGFNILDAALDPDSAASSAGGNLLMGLAAIGGPGAFKLLNMLSGKFRKACSIDNSFEGDTLVATEQGLVAIQNIRIGDKVWAYNEETGGRSLQPVVHLIEGEGSKEIVEISLASGEVINATTGHPFYVDGEWKDAGALAINDLLQRLSGEPLAVVGLLSQSEQTKVYNLTVANDHTYYVGESEVLAHNAGRCAPPHWSSKSLEHIFKGNKTGGYHHRFAGIDSGNSRVLKVTATAPSGKWIGSYKADIEICTGGKCIKKMSTFFPDSWTKSRVQAEVNSAYIRHVGKGGGSTGDFVEKSANGYPIRIIVKDGEFVTVHPSW